MQRPTRTPTRARQTGGLLLALLAAVFVIRAPLTSVPPALGAIRADLSLNTVAAGMVTTLPLVCFGVFAFLTPPLVGRVGAERTLGIALATICVGIVARLITAPSTFFLGTLAVGLGIAVANVVIPAIARAQFAGSLARVMGLYTVMIQVSGAVGAFLTRPLLASTGWNWPWALGVWLVPALIALVWWTIAASRHAVGTTRRAASVTRLSAVARRPVAWGVALVLGLQSIVFYSMVNWLPTLLHDEGWSLGAAGFALGTFNLLGLPGSFLGAQILNSPRRNTILCGVGIVYVTGLGLLVAGHSASIVGVLLAGLCQGPTLAVALSAIAHQRNPADVSAVSALAQGTGYLVSSLGPVVVGALYGVTHGFHSAIAVLVVIVIGWVLATMATTRRLAV